MSHFYILIFVQIGILLLIRETQTRNIVKENNNFKQILHLQMEKEKILKEELRERRSIYRFPDYADYGSKKQKKTPPENKKGYLHPNYGIITFGLG